MHSLPIIADPERRLALAYAPAAARVPLAALWALDEQLGANIAAARDPTLAELRLAWWRDALGKLAEGGGANDPLLRVLAPHAAMLPDLAPLADGWIALLGDLPLTEAALAAHAGDRGALLFRASAAILAADHVGVAGAGAGWALSDLASRIGDAETAACARRMAAAHLADARGRWPPPMRSLAVLAALARRDAADPRPRRQGAPGRLLRALWAGLSGY